MKETLKKLDLVGLVIIVGAMVVYSVREVWTLYQTIAVVVGAMVVVVSIASKLDEIQARLKRRSTGFGINSGLSVVLLVGVLGFINYLGARNEQRFDLTTEKIYSLADQSVSVSGQVEQGAHIRAFYPAGDDIPTRELLELYAARNSQITFEFIDPDRQPQLAEQFDVSVYGDFNNPLTGQTFRFGTVVLEMEGRQERIEKQSEPLREEDVTNALMKLMKGEQKVVYFIEGHGEKLIAETERTGLDVARKALERESYVVETLNLVREETIRTDAAVLIWPGPQTEPFPEEVEKVNAYLEQGGSVFVMVDPPPAVSLGSLLARWSLAAGENFIVDASGVGRLFGAGPDIPLVSQYGNHAITQRFNVMTFFRLARSISLADDVEGGLNVTELLTTSAQSWGESDLENTEASFDPQQDLGGPVTIGVVITKDLDENEKTRLVVFGDSDFASNSFFGQAGNGNLFLNTVNWLAEDENFISVRPKVPEDRRLTLTQSQGRITFYISLVLLPLSIVAAGISVWMTRRSG